jgi:hypothetical protein
MVGKIIGIGIVLAVVWMSYHAAWRNGYESALEDVRQGVVKVSFERY